MNPSGYDIERSLTALYFFFFNDTATTEIYTLSLHDALPISPGRGRAAPRRPQPGPRIAAARTLRGPARSEEHTSELQSPCNLVCRLLLEKKNTTGNCHQQRPPVKVRPTLVASIWLLSPIYPT